MAVYGGRYDDTVHVITPFRHYLHKIASDNEDMLEFVSSAGDRVTVSLIDEELSQVEHMKLNGACLRAGDGARPMPH